MFFSREKKLTVCVLCFSLAITVVPLNIFETVNADTLISYDDETPSSTKTFRSVEGYDYNAEVNTIAQWAGHSNIEITFTNTGDETIHDWYFTFDYNYEIENPYNCYVLEHEDDLYTIGNNDWNQDILPGESVTIGFTATSDGGSEISDEPSFYLLNTKTIVRSSSDLSWSFEQYSDWTTGFSGALILANNSEEQIRDWSITFNSNRPITQVDAAVLSTDADGVYTINNDGNNQNIAGGQSYRIELQGGENDPSEPFILTDYTVSAKALAYTLDEDNDDNGIVDVREIDFSGIVTVPPTSTPMPTATTTPVITSTPSPTVMPTTVPTINPTSSITPTPSPIITVTPSASATPTPTAMPTGFPDDIDYEKDTDSDGLPDNFEDYYGTDKNNPDTDSDGVNDYYELLLSTDPITPDSNGLADYDFDGLSNARESEQGTNPTIQDTDLDGLTDGEEVNLYGTDPTKYDTDDDGISDYNEIYLGSNAVIPDSDTKRYQHMDFEFSGDSVLKGVTKVTVSGYISGCIDENTKIRDIYGKDLHTSSIEALVGDPVNIETTGEYSSMTITFYYTDSLNENNLRIMWYDEENGEYIVLDNYSINKARNTISVTTTHFSKYMLIDEEVWVNTWIDACCEAGYISNIGNAYSLPLYIRRLNNKYDDNDGDGIVGILETSGMINNIGHVVYTDPGKTDTDSDDLSDGYEMGEFGVVGDIISYSKYTKYLDAWPVSLGSRYEDYVFLKQKSNPLKFDSDEDGSLDSVDETINTANEPVNYILIGKDHEGYTALSSMEEPYINAFKSINENVIVLGVYNGSDYDLKVEEFLNADIEPSDLVVFTFRALKLDLGADEICNKERYSEVDKLIIIAHGDSNKMQVAPSSNGNLVLLNSKSIQDLITPSCKINILDIQACLCGRPAYFDELNSYTCIAYEFLRKEEIDNVYAWTNTCAFLEKYNVSLSGGIYEKFYMINDVIIHKTVYTDKYFWSIPLYYPLEY